MEKDLGEEETRTRYTVYSTAYRDVIASKKTPPPPHSSAPLKLPTHAAYEGQATSQQVQPATYRGARVLAAQGWGRGESHRTSSTADPEPQSEKKDSW